MGPKRLDQAGLWSYALRALGRRSLTLRELRSRLEQCAAEPAHAPVVLAKLKEYGYLDDKRFADAFAAARIDNQKLGRQRVLRDLRARRVASAVAENAVEQAYRGRDEIALIEEFIARKFRGKDLSTYLAVESHLAGAYRKLRYAGFSSGNSLRVLKRYSRRADELEDAPEE